MVVTGTLPPLRGLILFPAQMLGGMIAAALVSCMFPGPLKVETSLTPGVSIAQGLFIEMFCTAELVITILMLAAEKSKATFIAPVGIGLALFVAELTGKRQAPKLKVWFGHAKGIQSWQGSTTLVARSTRLDHLALVLSTETSKDIIGSTGLGRSWVLY